MARCTSNQLSIVVFLTIGAALVVNCVDLENTDITPVTDETRYRTLNPSVVLDAFEKIRHVKGNYYFSKGKRITGDRLLINFLDSDSFSEVVDTEVKLRYPAKGLGQTITFIEVLADLSSDATADTFVTEGGISQTFVELLLECNQTTSFTYELFIYGY